MNFSGVSLHSHEIEVCQPKVYGDIQSHNMSSIIISYQLGHINTVRRARWDIARKEWKVDSVKIKIITFVIELGVKSIVTPNIEVQVRVIWDMLQLLSYSHVLSRFCISWKSHTILFVSNIENIYISYNTSFWGCQFLSILVKSLIVTPEMKKMIIHRQLIYQAVSESGLRQQEYQNVISNVVDLECECFNS